MANALNSEAFGLLLKPLFEHLSYDFIVIETERAQKYNSSVKPFIPVDFELKIVINRPVEEVFNFLWTLDERDFSNNKLVPVYENVTKGPRRIGSVIREVVKTWYFTMEVLSEITEYVPNRSLEYRFQGAGLAGTLRYILEAVEDGTELNQLVTISFKGLRKILNPLLPLTYARKAEWRLREIKGILEADSPPQVK